MLIVGNIEVLQDSGLQHFLDYQISLDGNLIGWLRVGYACIPVDYRLQHDSCYWQLSLTSTLPPGVQSMSFWQKLLIC